MTGSAQLEKASLRGFCHGLRQRRGVKLCPRILQMKDHRPRTDRKDRGDLIHPLSLSRPGQALTLSGREGRFGHARETELQLRLNMSVIIERRQLENVADLTIVRVIAGKCERRETTEPAADRDGDTFADTELRSLPEESGLFRFSAGI